MSLTLRQQIVDKLKLRLAAITTANGYQTNVGLNGGFEIDEWPTAYQEEELIETGRLGLFDLTAKKPQDSVDQKGVLNTMPCQVHYFHKRGTTPAQLRVVMGDIEAALITDPESGNEDATLGGLAVTMLSDEVGFIVPRDTFQIDGAAVAFDVLFLTAPFSAYHQ